jgi:uncharacterized protein (DUF885 family)
LRGFDRTSLTSADRIDYDVIRYLRDSRSTLDCFDIDIATPYVVSQQSGAYQSVPELLGAQHKIGDVADVEAYLARMQAFARVLDQETKRVRAHAAAGVLPPDFIIARTLPALAAMAGETADTGELVRNLGLKIQTAGIQAPGATASAGRIFTQEIAPALRRQGAALESLRPKASHDAGVWRLPRGGEYYAACLQWQTTTRSSAVELAAMGREQVAGIGAKLDTLLKAAGYTQGTVGERLRQLRTDPKLTYPATPAGRQEGLAAAEGLIGAMQKRLPQQFGVLPKTPVTVRAVAPDLEAGAPFAFYHLATLDGSRPGIFYINLGGRREHLTWELPALTFHEAIPGHHMHGSIQQESATLPLIRKVTWFNVFNEGWGLYAEQLADEMGAYESTPLGVIGYLSLSLLRAVRLVVDTGIHADRWSREQAIDYMCATLGVSREYALGEVDRYCVSPGQACSYMVGKQTFVRLRERAQARLGERFDSREFHDTILLGGSMPMDLVAANVENYIDRQRP